MRVQCHLSEDEIKIAIAEWFKILGRIIEPGDVIITHSTVTCSSSRDGTRDSYGASLSYEQSNGGER